MVDRESLKERVFAAVDAAEPMVRAYAEDIAANAELGFFETRTSAKLAGNLESLGLKLKKGIALTGLRADIGENKGPKVALFG